MVTQPDVGESMLFKLGMWRDMDEDESGRVTATELATFCNETKQLGYSQEIINEMMASADASGDGKISFMELINIIP